MPCVFWVSLQGVPGFLRHSRQTSLGVYELLVLGNPLLKSGRCLWRLSSSLRDHLNGVPLHLIGCSYHWWRLASCYLDSAWRRLFGTFLHCGRCAGCMRRLSLLTTSLWSAKQSAPHIVFVTLTSCLSFLHTMIYSMRCQCLERGCIHDVLLQVGRRKTVLVISSSCSAHFVKRRKSLLLHFPTPSVPITPSQVWWSVPTIALKSPRRMFVCPGCSRNHRI